jgi:hypothetical protein
MHKRSYGRFVAICSNKSSCKVQTSSLVAASTGDVEQQHTLTKRGKKKAPDTSADATPRKKRISKQAANPKADDDTAKDQAAAAEPRKQEEDEQQQPEEEEATEEKPHKQQKKAGKAAGGSSTQNAYLAAKFCMRL